MFIATAVYLAYSKENDSAWASIRETSRRPVGMVSFCLVFLCIVIIYFSKKGAFRNRGQGTTRAKILILTGVLAGTAAYSIEMLRAAGARLNPVVFSVHVSDGVTKKPITAARVTVDPEPGVQMQSPETGLTDDQGVFKTGFFSRSPSNNVGIRVEQNGFHLFYSRQVVQHNGNILVLLQALSEPPQRTTHVAFRSILHFSQAPFNLAASAQSLSEFKYGFSSLESDNKISGDGIQIKKIKLELKVLTHTDLVGFDAWVLLGPSGFGFPSGGVAGRSPYDVKPTTTLAPTQVRFVIGNKGNPLPQNSQATFWATYDFDSGVPDGFPNIDNFKGVYSAPMNLPTGLHAQVFVWNGNAGVNLDINDISLCVEGLKPGAHN